VFIFIREPSRVARRPEALVQNAGFQPLRRRRRRVRPPRRAPPGGHGGHGVRGVRHPGREPDPAAGQPRHRGHGEGRPAENKTQSMRPLFPSSLLMHHTEPRIDVLLGFSLQGSVILDPDFDIFREMGHLCKICKAISANKQLVKPGGAQCLPSGT